MKKRGIIMLTLLLFLFSLFILYTTYNRSIDIVTPVSETGQIVLPTPTPDPLAPFTLLLLGYAGNNHEGTLLTDTIIAAHIQPKVKSATLISIPRDLWVNIPIQEGTTSAYKINAAFAIGTDDEKYPAKAVRYTKTHGGGTMAKDVVGDVLGLSIHSYIAVNFNGFIKAIDALGGIDVTIQRTFEDPYYPIEGKEQDVCGKSEEEIAAIEATASGEKREQAFSCRFEVLSFQKGTMHMDGETALKFVRSRHSPTDGGDFARSQRQKAVIDAVKKKVFSVSFLPKALPFFTSLTRDIRTDISASSLQPLLELVGDVKAWNVSTLALTTDNGLMESITEHGQYILTPTNGNFAWEDIRKLVSERIASSSGTH